MFNLTQLHALIAAAALAGFSVPSRADDGDAAKTLDIGAVLAARGLRLQDLVTVHAAVPLDGRATWQNGLFAIKRTALPGAINVAADGNTSEPVSSLKLTSATDELHPMLVEACRAGRCEPAAVKVNSKSDVVATVDKASVQININGAFCSGDIKTACNLFMPSWSLSQLFRGDGSMPTFPELLAILQTRDRILLVDAPRSQTWLELSAAAGSPAAGLGWLLTSTFFPNGELVLTFEHGALLFSLTEDLVLLATEHGDLWLKSEGVSDGRLEDFSLVFDGGLLGGSSIKLLALAPGMAITSAGLVNFALTHDAGFQKLSVHDGVKGWQQAHVSVGKDGAPTAVIAAVQLGSASVLSAHGGTVESLSDYAITTSTDPSILKLVSTSLFAREGAGWSLLGVKGGPVATSIAGGRKAERIVPATGDLLISRAMTPNAGNMCEWTHYRTVAPGSFQEDGVAHQACDLAVTFDRANAGGDVVMSSWSGAAATFRVWHTH